VAHVLRPCGRRLPGPQSKDGGERVVKLQAGRGKPSKPGVAARAPKGSKDFIIEKAQKAVLYQADDGDDDDDDFLPPL